MAIALLLLILVVAETFATVWLLARHGEYLRRLRDFEMALGQLESKLTEKACTDE